MRTYSLITKPILIELSPPRNHKLINKFNHELNYVDFEPGDRLWVVKAWSKDHPNFQSTILFKRDFLTTFSALSKTVRRSWVIVDEHPKKSEWLDELLILNLESKNVFLLWDGSIPNYVQTKCLKK